VKPLRFKNIFVNIVDQPNFSDVNYW